MQKLKLLITIFLLLCSNLLFADSIKKIRFATEATYPPFEFIDQAGKVQGFDVEIANALCAKISAECTFTTQAFNSLIPSVKLGKFDAIIASLGITPERQQQVSFTNAYYLPSASFVAALAKHYTLTDISGKIVGAQQGSTFEKYLHDKYHDKITIKAYASIQDAFLDLVAGRVDMVLADTPIAQEWLLQTTNSNNYGIFSGAITDPEYFGTGYGIAVRKDNVELLNALNKALADIKADGTYEKISKKYFGK